MRESIKAGILERLPASSKAHVAQALGRRRDDSTFTAAWADLESAGKIAKDRGEWNVVVVPQPLGNNDHHNNGHEAGDQLDTGDLVPVGSPNGSKPVDPAPASWIEKHTRAEA